MLVILKKITLLGILRQEQSSLFMYVHHRRHRLLHRAQGGIVQTGKANLLRSVSVCQFFRVDRPTISSPLPRAELPNNIGSEWLAAISSCTRRAQMPSQCQSPGSRACGLPSFRSPGPAPPRRCAFHACHAPGFPAASDGKESRTSSSSKVDRI